MRQGLTIALRLLVMGALSTAVNYRDAHAERDEQCLNGEYIVERSAVSAKRAKSIEVLEQAGLVNLELAEETKSAMLVEEAGADPKDGDTVSAEEADLCDKVRVLQRSRRRAARRGEGLQIVRDVSCSCNSVLEALGTPNDGMFANLWGMHQQNDIDMDMPEAWDKTTGSSGTIVAVIDSGVDYTHPDLADNMWRNPGEIPGNSIDDDGNGYVDDVHGINAINNNGNPMDDHGHGTHVAGTIGAVGNNSIGVAGVNWKVRIIGAKFLASNGYGSLFDAIECVDYVTALKNAGHNVVLSNNSWGGGPYSSALYNSIASARAAGVLFVAAAGNSGVDADVNPMYPAAYNLDNIISVAAIDMQGNRAGFSNYGATSVDIAAPGVSIASTFPGNSYRNFQGTSMASPHVAGALALLQSYSANLTWQELRDNLYANGVARPSLIDVVATGKLVNAANMLAAAPHVPQPPDGSEPEPTPTPVLELELHSALADGDDLTLVYSKNFSTCAKIWVQDGGSWRQSGQAHDFICSAGEQLEVHAAISSTFNPVLEPGDIIRLCHGAESEICSESVQITAPIPPSLEIFATSATYAPNFGGLAGADIICQQHANAAGRSERFIALISSASVDARSRIIGDLPIYNTHGDPVAVNPADLWDGGIISPVRYDESGNDLGSAAVRGAWTATGSNGMRRSPSGSAACADWRSNAAGNSVAYGQITSSDAGWLDSDGPAGSGVPCGQEPPLRLLCIEQAGAALPVPGAPPVAGTWSVTGKAVTSTGAPIAEARIELRFGATSLVRITGTDGSFSFPDIEGPVEYTLNATHGGFEFTPLRRFLAADADHTLTGSAVLYLLRGYVFSPSQAPLSDVTVNGGSLGAVQTDAQGEFRFTAPYGTVYELNFSKSGITFERNGLRGTIFGNVSRHIVGRGIYD